ncbi:ABC transporter substrate-binding protein [Halomicrobium mukohataei]|uniref:ABC transporter substrate-binding protein n=1 Tax=Halomicrobium mukohataei TaxID=57705 RepID=A0A847UGN4_9EURY|nr:ABC transporter substrate-binding protein [Halomicrobium mukohataei]NLV11646.1 ABC transporter substrate-binding protein [Halomicrobium mukohataei]
MANDATNHRTPTRRECVKYGGTIVGSGLLAGCTSRSDSEPTPTESETPESYSAELPPVGRIEFDSEPEDVFTILSHHAGMALAAGRGDAINAMHAPGYVESLYETFLHRLDGVSVDWEGLYSSWPPSKEKLYELDSDVHLADPAKVATTDAFDAEDIDEIEENVAPWFGNTFSDTHQEPPEAYADDYEYYTLWEIFARVADVFRAGDRYEALAAIHRSMLDRIERDRPQQDDRSSAMMVLFAGSSDTIWAYELNQPGYYASHTRPLGAPDALADIQGEVPTDDYGNLTVDTELLLEADPEVLLVLGPLAGNNEIEEIREQLGSDPVASELTAVQNDRVYAQGARRQGPLLNLFQLEMTAKQLYPDQFGEWPGYVDGEPYPEIPASEQLFDRDRVADIVTGNH